MGWEPGASVRAWMQANAGSELPALLIARGAQVPAWCNAVLTRLFDQPLAALQARGASWWRALAPEQDASLMVWQPEQPLTRIVRLVFVMRAVRMVMTATLTPLFEDGEWVAHGLLLGASQHEAPHALGGELALLELLMRDERELFIVTDLGAVPISVSRTLLERLDYASLDVLPGETLHASLHPEDAAVLDHTVTRACEGDATSTVRWRMLRRDGGELWTEWRVRLVAANFLVWIGHTIQEALLNQRELERLRALVEHTQEFAGIATERGEPLYLNRMGRRLLGLEPDQPLDTFLAPGAQARALWAHCEREIFPSLRERGYWVGELTWAHLRTGEQVHLLHHFYLFHDEDASSSAPLIVCTGTNVTPYREMVQALTQREAQLNDLFDNASALILSVDRHGAFRFANDAFLRALDLSRDALEWITLWDVLAPQSQPMMRQMTTGEQPSVASPLELVLITRDGQQIYLEGSFSARREGAGEVTALRGIFHDISERKRLDQLQREFVSIVSHELRTPLTSIKGALGLLRSGAMVSQPEQSARLLALADHNSDRLIRLINDILDMERLEDGHLPMTVSELRLASVVEAAVEANQALVELAGVRLRVTLSWPQAQVIGDADRLIQVITNLISNAVKFSTPGQTISVTLSRRAQDYARVSVRDHGPGVPAGMRARIFERFVQADASDARARGGSGLGLSIARGIVTRHGGRIGVEEASPGARFYFELPPLGEARQALLPSSAPRRGVVSASVLVVEDDPDLAALFGVLVGELGLESSHASTAEQARSAIMARRFDAILLDIMLPDESGLALLRSLRQQRGLTLPPVIVITALSALHVDASEEHGVDIWLTKPLEITRLRQALRRVIPTLNRELAGAEGGDEA